MDWMFGNIFKHRDEALVLRGPNIYLRPPRKRDSKAWMALRLESDRFLKAWEPQWAADACSIHDYKRRLQRFDRGWDQGNSYGFFLFDKIGDNLLGGLTLTNVRRGVVQTANLGYWIGEPYARQGYMSEAIQLSLRFAFQVLGLHRVEAACLKHNMPSRKLLLKNGFYEEGLARDYLRIDGQWQDHVTFAILNKDPREKLAFYS
jgi:ribosomal-protein-alanine N-acetyltransferase